MGYRGRCLRRDSQHQAQPRRGVAATERSSESNTAPLTAEHMLDTLRSTVWQAERVDRVRHWLRPAGAARWDGRRGGMGRVAPLPALDEAAMRDLEVRRLDAGVVGVRHRVDKAIHTQPRHRLLNRKVDANVELLVEEGLAQLVQLLLHRRGPPCHVPRQRFGARRQPATATRLVQRCAWD